MRAALCALLILASTATCVAAKEEENPVKGDAPAKAAAMPRFAADTSQAPELQPWGLAAEALCQVWYPRIVALLKGDDTFRPLDPVVKIIFEKGLDAPAYATESEIHVSVEWIKMRPNEFGMVIHELTHLVQRYPEYEAGWLVEGIADYVRIQHFEPALPLSKLNFEKAKYTDGFKTSARFLGFVEAKYSRDLIPKLNDALRKQKYSDELFKEMTGKEVGVLWNEFAEAERQKDAK